MTQSVELETQRHNESEVDRAARRHDGPDYTMWSMVIAMGFLFAIVTLSLAPIQVPESLRTALVDLNARAPGSPPPEAN